MPAIDTPISESTTEALEETSQLLDRVDRELAVTETADQSATAAEQPPTGPTPKRAWYWRWVDNGPALLAILFLGTGAFGLPLLYHSRAFSVRMKWIIAVVNTFYTVASCYWAYLEIVRYVGVINSALSTM